jgi:putative sterol carrier protein
MSKSPADPTARFFDELAARGDEPLLQKASGSTRFDIVDGKRTLHWLVSVDRGKIAVSKQKASADCAIRTQKAVFDKVAVGGMNAVAAVLRGDMAVEGDWRLLVRMARLFPASPGSLRSAARRRRRS